ncbi:hypothetical protein A1O3_03207 [Capronia epimyces CBS 606.96]|uniref:Uncharacterized protein n=1 Tax=Capronia epimyces CBS 606.96 TaxID=1182542 RepID=W9YC81_9EURO|nr:uncharacterized protein A1O3_03207 [Capronia epimyces CBS 606.96]EXJ90138.1 hypothetical protein A1O3_03207 [Capronia epimyces CBS 606.96]
MALFRLSRRYRSLRKDSEGTELKDSPVTSHPLDGDDAPFNFEPGIPDTVSSPERLDTHWNPPFLRLWVLATFAVFFIGVIVGLQAVYSVSVNHDGIARTDDNKHYLWTYGPTALFVLVTVLWRQVDYSAKSIQPWAEMAKGPQPATNSLLLDYVTPFQIVALWKSLRSSHFSVSCTIVVFFLLKVITIVSTGIFSLRSVQRDDVGTPMAINNTFEGSNFDQGASVDSRAAYIVFGHQQYNVSLPTGTIDTYAAQSFHPSHGFINGSLTYSALVDVFSASLDCKSGKLSHTSSFDSGSNAPTASYYNTSVSLPDCQIFNASLDAPDWYYQPNDKAHRFGYRGLLQNVTCANLPPDDPKRLRYMVAVAYSEGLSQNENNMINSSNIVCVPSYSIRQGMVTLDAAGNIKSVNLTGSTRQLDGVDGNGIGNGVLATAQQASSIMSDVSPDLVLDSFMTLMQQETEAFVPEQLLDSEYLNKAANTVFGKIAAQLANLYLLKPTTSDPAPTVEGTVSKYENRLVAREDPIRAMQGIAGAMLLITVILLFIIPRGVVPRSVDSIAALAAILARSPALEISLRGTGHMSLDQIATLLRPHRYFTRVGYEEGVRSFSIHVTPASEDENNPYRVNIDAKHENVKWSRPFVLRRITISFAILASIATIIALEVLLSQSQKNNGLGSVNGDTATRYSWLYAPVLVFLLLGTLFNILDFEIEFVESYHALAKGYCNAKSSLLWNPTRHVSVHATWNGLKHNRFALTAASASAILAPFLTIVVSGLFSTKATLHLSPVQVTALNWFNTTTLMSPSTNIPALVIEGNMSYPQWTYDELAFPKLEIVQNITSQGEPGVVSVDTPALRGAATCYAVPQDRLLETTVLGGYLTSNISTPDGCGNSGFIDQPYLWLTNSLPIPVNSSGYFGQTLTLGFGAPSCPTLALYYGHASDNRADSFGAILCTQYLERVQANVTLQLPDLSISTEPTVRPGSAANFSSWYMTFPQFQIMNVSNQKDELDNVFSAMVYGRDGVPAAELLNGTKLIESYQHLYRQYMAQIASLYLRTDFSTLSNNATETVANPLQATYTDPSRLRLVQSSLSTHLLVGVMAALLICAATIFITVDMRNVLPKPMGSLAAVASLLAGSRLVDGKSGLTPKGSEFWSDGDWERSGVWQGQMFRMGWWDKFNEPAESWSARQPDMVGGTLRDDAEITSDPDLVPAGRALGAFRIDARPTIVA